MQPGESKELIELTENIVIEHKLRWFGLVNAHILPHTGNLSLGALREVCASTISRSSWALTGFEM